MKRHHIYDILFLKSTIICNYMGMKSNKLNIYLLNYLFVILLFYYFLFHLLFYLLRCYGKFKVGA